RSVDSSYMSIHGFRESGTGIETAHTRRLGRKWRHADTPLVSLDSPSSTSSGLIGLEFPHLICKSIVQIYIMLDDVAISRQRPEAALIASLRMDEYAIRAKLRGDAAQLDGEPRRRFGPAGRVSLPAGERGELGV